MQHIKKRYNNEWLLISLFVLAVTALLSINKGLPLVYNRIYDFSIRLTQDKPASEEIVIIAIDDKSIADLGPWPWRRSTHANLLDSLQQSKSVAFDLLFMDTLPEYAADDAIFADAIRNHGRVILANYFPDSTNKSNNPEPKFVEAARDLGFININIDPDGLVRRMFLQKEQADGTLANHLTLAMLSVANEQDLIKQTLQRAKDPDLGIPFTGIPGNFKMVSYSDVLHKRIPASFFKDKYVLIGVWGSGLGDQFPTPISSQNLHMSGVEILANSLQASLDQTWIKRASPTFSLLCCLLPVLVLCFFMKRSSPRTTLLLSLLTIALILLIHSFLMYQFGLWYNPLPSIVGILMLYPLWSWRTQEIALYQMRREIAELNEKEPLFKTEIKNRPIIHYNRSLNDRLAEFRGIMEQVRSLRQFIMDGINRMPDAIAVFNLEHRLQFTTDTTKNYMHKVGAKIPEKNQALAQFLVPVIADQEQRAEILTEISHISTGKEQPSSILEALRNNGVEIKDCIEQNLLLKYVNTYSGSGEHIGYILSLNNITAIREAERKREETLRFLSHDMRSPQSSIQALIELQKNPQSALPEDEFFQRIHHLSGRTLKLVDDFLQLTRAESMTLNLAPINLTELLEHIIHEYWAISQKRNINIISDFGNQLAFTKGDYVLLSRCFVNLIDNAFKYSPDNTTIHCSIQRQSNYWQIRIMDQGIGIAEKNHATIFKSFFRVPGPDIQIKGIGLGLSFVKTVIKRHGGQIHVESEPGNGATFIINLPLDESEESV
ncbi:CHASE2 domain-containing protein [Advenella sp. RU8]|uniref:CHASE2 domain-containing protein n=1 Tax=Advenella sp. RU8 TaxID=3399575 RepID=UPI003AAF3B5F